MSKKNKKNQKPELELSYPYATFTPRKYCGGFWVYIQYESGVAREQAVVDTASDAHYFAAKHGCKVWLDGEKVKAISSVAIAKVQEEETEAAQKAKAEEDARNEKIASMRNRPLTEDEIAELPNLFLGGEWFGKNGCLGDLGVFFARGFRNGNCLVFASKYGPNDVRLVSTPYEHPKKTYMSGYRDEQPSRLNDDGHF